MMDHRYANIKILLFYRAVMNIDQGESVHCHVDLNDCDFDCITGGTERFTFALSPAVSTQVPPTCCRGGPWGERRTATSVV